MSADEGEILEALGIGAAALAFGVAWWWGLHRKWKRDYGPIAAYVALTIFLYLIGSAIAWCASLLPPINDPMYTTYLGIGGGAYARNYSLYPKAMLWWCAMALLVFLSTECAFIWRVGRKAASSALAATIFKEPRKMIVDLWAILLLAAAVAAFASYYGTVGWNSLIWSEGGRFELNGMVVESAQGVRWFLPTFLTTGCLAALLLCLRGNPVTLLCAWILSAVPFVAFASRGLSLLAVAAGVAVVYRFRRYRRLTVLPVAIGVAVCAWLPLRLREEPNTGLRVLVDVVTGQTRGTFKSNGWSDVAILMLQNSGQGFGVFCEVVSRTDGSSRGTVALAPGYIRSSFSPLPSALDGFAVKYLNKDPRVNPYTPFSAFAELLVYSPWAFFGIPALAAMITTGFLVQPRVPGKVWMVCSLILGLLVINGFVQASQYAIRTADRYIYAAWMLGAAEIVCGGVYRVALGNLRSANRARASAGI